ncbi:Uu.00g072200.m01.CDS01 [Anthostomella pinea]|uniref:Uu.00g072200.m01.CDS01 n=1 Tax=Anthostomella pinea TaxID=933095 RepID=A0AAI8VVX4_9PEZI|nr:Uu.00g072200.m01.CDS01 [Anthostomella pinea]
MSAFSPLRRHFTPPFARPSSSLRSDAELSEQEDLAQDSKDVLIQRLNDLAAKLSQQDHVREQNVNSLHAKVDEMENVLLTPGYPLSFKSRKSKKSKPKSLNLRISRHDPEVSWESPRLGQLLSDDSYQSSPTQVSSSVNAGGGHHGNPTETDASHSPSMSKARAEQVVAEAQTLCKGMEEVIISLRARQEETEHIHGLLITRAERAAQHIICLEARLKELESERNEGEMDMLNLQIQLKAIEVQSLSYVPKDADPDLRASIAVWKEEWSTLKRRRAKKKAEQLGTDDTPTPTPATRRRRTPFRE